MCLQEKEEETCIYIYIPKIPMYIYICLRVLLLLLLLLLVIGTLVMFRCLESLPSCRSQQVFQVNKYINQTWWFQSPPWTSHANGPSSQITWTLPCGGCSPESLFLAALHKKVPKTAVTSVSEWQLRAQNSNYIPQRHDGMSVFPFLSHKQSSARMKSAEFRSSGVNHHISQT